MLANRHESYLLIDEEVSLQPSCLPSQPGPLITLERHTESNSNFSIINKNSRITEASSSSLGQERQPSPLNLSIHLPTGDDYVASAVPNYRASNGHEQLVLDIPTGSNDTCYVESKHSLTSRLRSDENPPNHDPDKESCTHQWQDTIYEVGLSV